jgi:hypothetical protein
LPISLVAGQTVDESGSLASNWQSLNQRGSSKFVAGLVFAGVLIVLSHCGPDIVSFDPRGIWQKTQISEKFFRSVLLFGELNAIVSCGML